MDNFVDNPRETLETMPWDTLEALHVRNDLGTEWGNAVDDEYDRRLREMGTSAEEFFTVEDGRAFFG